MKSQVITKTPIQQNDFTNICIETLQSFIKCERYFHTMLENILTLHNGLKLNIDYWYDFHHDIRESRNRYHKFIGMISK